MSRFETEEKKRVFSGTRATGRLHLGNYFGAIRGYIDLQNREDLDCLYMVVDLHTITTPFNRDTLSELTNGVVLDYLSTGLDPEKSIITLQSLVPQHTYLSWLMSAFTSIDRLQHLPTFKEKVKLHPENVNLALFSYPILMAADILLYKAELVPVGQDQEPHLEIAREVARKSNSTFGTSFPEPQRFATPINVVPSLAGEGKMSKSVEGSTIYLTDTAEEIRKKIAKVPTNSGKGSINRTEKTRGGVSEELIEYLDQNGNVSPGVFALMSFVGMFMGNEAREYYEDQYEGNGVRFGDMKKELSGAIAQTLQPFQDRREEIERDPDYVEDVIMDGAKKAEQKAKPTLEEMRDAMGFWKPSR